MSTKPPIERRRTISLLDPSRFRHELRNSISFFKSQLRLLTGSSEDLAKAKELCEYGISKLETMVQKLSQTPSVETEKTASFEDRRKPVVSPGA